MRSHKLRTWDTRPWTDWVFDYPKLRVVPTGEEPADSADADFKLYKWTVGGYFIMARQSRSAKNERDLADWEGSRELMAGFILAVLAKGGYCGVYHTKSYGLCFKVIISDKTETFYATTPFELADLNDELQEFFQEVDEFLKHSAHKKRPSKRA